MWAWAVEISGEEVQKNKNNNNEKNMILRARTNPFSTNWFYYILPSLVPCKLNSLWFYSNIAQIRSSQASTKTKSTITHKPMDTKYFDFISLLGLYNISCMLNFSFIDWVLNWNIIWQLNICHSGQVVTKNLPQKFIKVLYIKVFAKFELNWLSLKFNQHLTAYQ